MRAPTPVLTADGSHTLYHPETGEHYHSTHGAVQESVHVFIGAALSLYASNRPSLDILEVGFGTGLNALLTMIWSTKHSRNVHYTAIEPFPVPTQLAEELNYANLLGTERDLFLRLHAAAGPAVPITPHFSITRIHDTLQSTSLPADLYDIVFFDAFSPAVQPEMWIPEVFTRLCSGMKKGGVLTTYSSKGSVKRALVAGGFSVEKIPGPPGKREMLRAIKKS